MKLLNKLFKTTPGLVILGSGGAVLIGTGIATYTAYLWVIGIVLWLPVANALIKK